MGKRLSNYDDMEIQAIKSDLTTLNKRVDELIILLTGNSIYGVKGIKADVAHLKDEVHKIKVDVENMKRDKGMISIKLDTLPSRIGAFIILFGTLITMVKTLMDILSGQ